MLKLFQIRSSLTINKHMIANSDISKTDTGADARPDRTGKRPDDGWNLACGRTREQRDPLLWRPVSSPCTSWSCYKTKNRHGKRQSTRSCQQRHRSSPRCICVLAGRGLETWAVQQKRLSRVVDCGRRSLNAAAEEPRAPKVTVLRSLSSSLIRAKGLM